MKETDPTTYLNLPYARVLTPDEEGGYSAEILEFPGCFAEGDTVTEAFENLEEVAALWLQVALEQGQTIPPPLKNQTYAGRIALRLPRDLHRQAVTKAQRDETSLNQYLVSAVAAWVGADNLLDKIAERACHLMQVNMVQINFSTQTQPDAQTNIQWGAIQQSSTGGGAYYLNMDNLVSTPKDVIANG